jgi:hypothetical protein
VYTGTNKRWLQYKGSLAGGQKVTLVAPHTGQYANAKPLWRMATKVNPVFTQYHERDVLDVIQELDMTDIAMWYLDDGCTIERRDYVRTDGKLRYRYLLCIGSICPTTDAEAVFLESMQRIFKHVIDRTVGTVVKNNSRATQYNKTWQVPVCVGRHIVIEARRLGDFGFNNKLRCR